MPDGDRARYLVPTIAWWSRDCKGMSVNILLVKHKRIGKSDLKANHRLCCFQEHVRNVVLTIDAYSIFRKNCKLSHAPSCCLAL